MCVYDEGMCVCVVVCDQGVCVFVMRVSVMRVYVCLCV